MRAELQHLPTRQDLTASIDITVATPNDQLFARLRGKYDVTITIRPGFVERAGDPETEVQLGRLCRLLFLHRADRLNRIDAELMDTIPRPPRQLGPRDLEFERRYEQIGVTETSSDGSLSLHVVGMQSWVWEVQPGTTARQTSEQVAHSATEVANRMALRLADEVRKLTIEVFHDHD